MKSSDNYGRLTNGGISMIRVLPKAYVPMLNQNDYTKGYINRYFAQKANDINSPITEVEISEYTRLRNSGAYNVASLRWRITGSFDPVITNGITTDKGIRISNLTSIRLASTNIPNLKLYLPNLVQFHKK